MKIFSKLDYDFLGYLNPTHIHFLIVNINSFPGELSDVSAKTATLLTAREVYRAELETCFQMLLGYPYYYGVAKSDCCST